MITIKNDIDYDRVLAEIEHIMTMDDAGMASHEQLQRMDKLADAVVQYENDNYPIPEPVLKARAIWWFTMKTKIGRVIAGLIWR